MIFLDAQHPLPFHWERGIFAIDNCFFNQPGFHPVHVCKEHIKTDNNGCDGKGHHAIFFI
jgi:hypothetical protein